MNESTTKKTLGTFAGVFVPTFLSIIGVIMYLRLGFVVGSAGLLGTIIIILLATSITFATGLSLSSIVSNIRIGSGAVYAIISKTLGIEVGGSVGIPLYLAQVFSVALYILGFAEGWQFIFPTHPFKTVVLLAFLSLFVLTFISTKIAIKAQMIVFVIVLASLVSVFSGGGAWWIEGINSSSIGSFTGTSFWAVFALFFPAVTGLMAGIGLSGELSDPKRQIPIGVLSSLIITTILYICMAFWFSSNATPEALSADSLIIVKLAAYGPIVLAGILAATFSSALTTFIAAPRLLQSLAENSILPFSNFFIKKTHGEPRNATLFTSTIITFSLIFGSLDSIAPILTMFFLITYAMINMVVFIEQSLGLPSFRPTLRIPRIVPLYGALGSGVVMFLISPTSGFIAIGFLTIVYITLVQRKLIPNEGDVRSGLFRSLAEWAAKKVQSLPESEQHTWKPNILLPAINSATVYGNFPLIKAIAYPNGTMTVIGMKVKNKNTQPSTDIPQKNTETVNDIEELPKIIQKFGEEGIFTSSSIVETDDYSKGISISLEAIESQVFHPNILFLPYKARQFTIVARKRIADAAAENNVSVILFDRDEDLGLGSEQDIHVWIGPEVLEKEFYEDRNFDLALLVGFKLAQNWQGKLNLWMCVKKEQKAHAEKYLEKLIYEGRLPKKTSIHIEISSFIKTLTNAPKGDIHIISSKSEKLHHINKIAKIKGKSFLFVTDSSLENILT